MAKRKLVLKGSEKETRLSYHSVDVKDSQLACIADHPQHIKTAIIRGTSYFSAYATVIDKATLLNDSRAHFCCAAKIRSLVLYDRSDIWPTCATIKNIHMYMDSSGVIEQDKCDDRPIKVNTIHMYGNSKLELYENAEVDCIYLHSFSRLRLESNVLVKRVVMSGGSRIYSRGGGRIDMLIMRDNAGGHIENMTVGRLKVSKNVELETYRCNFEHVISSGHLILENMDHGAKSINVYGGFTSLYVKDEDIDADFQLAEVENVKCVAGKFYLGDNIAHISKLSVSKKCLFDGGVCLDEYVDTLRWHGKPMDPSHWATDGD